MHGSPGADVPPDKAARLLIGGGIVVKKIDGRTHPRISLDTFDRSWRYPDTVPLPPGTHTLTVSCEGGFLASQPEADMKLEAQTGNPYVLGKVVYVDRNGSKKAWRAVIIDKGMNYAGGVSEHPVYRIRKSDGTDAP